MKHMANPGVDLGAVNSELCRWTFHTTQDAWKVFDIQRYPTTARKSKASSRRLALLHGARSGASDWATFDAAMFLGSVQLKGSGVSLPTPGTGLGLECPDLPPP